jgi:hypothetical protein
MGMIAKSNPIQRTGTNPGGIPAGVQTQTYQAPNVAGFGVGPGTAIGNIAKSAGINTDIGGDPPGVGSGIATPVNQSPNFLGMGQYFNQPYPGFNPGLISGTPSMGGPQDYGLNDVWSQMQAAINRIPSQGAQMATAPQFGAAQGQAAMGTAAQGAAAQGNSANYGAALGNAAQAAPTYLSTAGDLGFMGQQQNLANILGAQAAGYGVSPADLQLQQGRDANVAAQLAILGSQRGSTNAALAQRSAADQGAAANAQLNQQMALQRAQETLQAQQALGGVLGTARGQSQNYNLNSAQLAQGLNLANMGAQNTFGLANLGALNAANAGNAGLSQQMGLANLGNAQQTGLANLGAQNQFGMANLENAQQMGLANLGNMQQQNLANQSMLGQYGLANQQAQLANTQLQNQQLNAMLGGMTGIAQSNRAAQLAAQQLGVQQQIAGNQINEQAFQAAAANNQNLAGALFSGAVGLGSAALQAWIANGKKGPPPPGVTDNAGTLSYTDPNTGQTQVIGPDAPVSTSDTSGINWGYDPSAPASTESIQVSDRRQKTGITDADIAGTLRHISGLFAVSDENLKEGIQGGNPMLDSFLRQYHESMGAKDEDKINVTSGLDFHNATSARMPTGGGGGGGGGGLGPLGMLLPIAGGILGGPLGAAAGAAAEMGFNSAAKGSGGGGGGGTTTVQTSPGSGTTAEGDIANIGDEDTTLSDDREKEAVMSGNRGIQAFLEQQNAQQGAQANQGATNNAFMQTGQAPSSQMDRQLPPWMGGGYGGNFGGYGMPWGMGGVYGGGVTDFGGYGGASMGAMGGIAQSPAMTNMGGVSQMGGQLNATPPPNMSYTPWSGGNLQSNVGVSAPATGSPSGFTFAPVPPPAMPPQLPPQLLAPKSNVVSVPAPSPLQNSFAPAPLPTGLPSIVGRRAAVVSDEDEKTDAKGVQEMLDHLHAYSYRYKDPSMAGAAPGRRVGVMAQDLEKSPLGASFVREQDGHKVVDYGQALGAMMAAHAAANDRLNEHEEMLRALGAGRGRAVD